MKKIKLDTKEFNHFIGCWNIEDDNLMNNLISFFEGNPKKTFKGRAGGKESYDIKDSIDLTISPKELNNENYKIFHNYFSYLNQCYSDYLNEWSFLKSKWGEMHIGPFNIQKYEPGGHFKHWHTEIEDISQSHRSLVWMTYLNNVNDGGFTDFLYQKMSIKPEIGKTLIWPAQWTHAHRGQIVNQNKYIITGWFHFPKKN